MGVRGASVTHAKRIAHVKRKIMVGNFTICGSVERVGQTMYIHGILSESFIYCEVAGFSSLRQEACELKQSYHNIYLHCLIIEAILRFTCALRFACAYIRFVPRVSI